MISVMSTSNDGRFEPSSDPGNGAVGEEKTVASTTAVDSAGGSGLSTVGATEEAAGVGVDRSEVTRTSDDASDLRVLKLENEENRFGDASRGENQPSASVSRVHGNSRKTGARKLESKKNRNAVEDYDTILSAFDEFAATEKDEAVGYGYKVGDMVWGKVKSHPWWPGHIYSEAFASPSVRRGKHEGHVLVAFFGDSSYGWFDLAELIPFEENFAEKSRQTTSRAFSKAVEEAVDELSRRSSLGLACRCRNKFNFWPASVQGYYVVDVGDYEPGVYSSTQISKERESFKPREMLSFLKQLALKPINHQHWTIDVIKNKAAVLACRKAFFEEFDETYAQAFGTVPVRPPRPTAPVAVDPSKAPLTGRLVIAEALRKGKIHVKPPKTKDQVEKDKYLFKRRDESIQVKSKKTSSSQVGHSLHPLLVDGKYSGIRDHMHYEFESGVTDGQRPPVSHQATISSDIKPSEGSRKLVEGGPKKAKVPKRRAGEFAVESAVRPKKKKQKMNEASPETGGKVGELPVSISNSTVALENVSGMPVHVQLMDDNGLDNQKKDVALGSSSAQSLQAVDFGKVELQMLVRDLRALALNPFHGEPRSCPAVIRQVFLKFRSLVYQKSLVLVPPVEGEASEGNSSRLPAPTVLVGPADKTNDKIVKPSVRLDDPTRGGKKHGPSDRPEDAKKKKLGVLEGVKKRVDDYSNVKKKKIDNSKLLTVGKKILQRSNEPQRADVKDVAAKALPPTLPKAVKLESSKRVEHAAKVASPTMLVMKFPTGAALPSGAELRAKFARFGPLDHSATRIFWKSYTCRLVYLHKTDAEGALKFALGSSNLFGNANARCYIRELENEAAEAEQVKLQKEDVSIGASQSRDSAVEQRMAMKIASQPLQYAQSSVQLKSCLKKPSGDESGNGGGRSARVKFVLGGDESSKGELLFNENMKNNIASFPQGASSSSSSIYSLDSSSKILPNFNPQSSNTLAPSTTTSTFQNFPVSMLPSSEQVPRLFNAPPNPQMSGAPPHPQTPGGAAPPDISQQMLYLLNKCNEAVNNIAAELGYMPYHSL